MSKYQEKYDLWKKLATDDRDIVCELDSIAKDEEAIADRFYKELEFGTGGLRGVIGAGDNRMNLYTVRKATMGLANYLNTVSSCPKVAISFDSRIKSDVFAKAAAEVLASCGIKSYIYKQLEPTPVLSFTVRYLGCDAGIMITASHNPAKYNGYKCYGSDGCQITDDFADKVMSHIKKVDIFKDVTHTDFQTALSQGMIEYTPDEVLEKYYECVKSRMVNKDVHSKSDLKVLYTPLNGTGNIPVREILKRTGVKDVKVVPAQELPDGNFPTAPYPNPEIREAFACALEEVKTYPADIILATDPDCDRVGIAVRDTNGEYVLTSGNEVGCMLLDYILKSAAEKGTLRKDAVAVTTIVSSKLSLRIAAKYGCEVKEVLTGFKYIGEQIGLLEAKKEEDRFVFGFEESYGYLSGSYVRDKDAVVGSMLICEMAAYYKAQGKNLLQVMSELYNEHGYFAHRLVNLAFEGEKGMSDMKTIMDRLRNDPPKSFAGFEVLSVSDYFTHEKKKKCGCVEKLELPKSNVLSYELPDCMSFIVRPSGTEPKIKAYLTACAKDKKSAEKTLDVMEEAARTILKI